MTKSTSTIPVRATTVFLPMDENSQAINALVRPGEEVEEAEDADISIRGPNIK
jgi:hypothetical protein